MSADSLTDKMTTGTTLRVRDASEVEAAVSIFLYRWASSFADQEAYARRVEGLLEDPPAGFEAEAVRPRHVLPGRSRIWLRLTSSTDTVLTNGVLLVQEGSTAQPVLAAMLAHIFGNKPWTRVGFVQGGDGLDELIERFAIWTTVLLSLDDISRFDRRRPRTEGERSVTHFERLIEHPILRYSAGVGARLRIIAPWRRHISAYRQRIADLSLFWQRVVAPALATPAPAIATGLFEPLELLRDFSHDQDILAEYESKLEALADEANGIAQRVGGFLGVLAVILAYYSLTTALAVGGAALLYFYGLDELIYRLRRPLRLLRKGRDAYAFPFDRLESVSLGAFARRAAAEPLAIVVGSYLAVIDYACAFGLWVDLLDRTTAPPVRITKEPAPDELVVVIGGPLSVPARRAFPPPYCELAPADAVFSRWAYIWRNEVICSPGSDDTIGCLSCVHDTSGIVYADGFRGIGVELAVACLRDGLDRGFGPEGDDAWVLVRYDAIAGRAVMV